MAGSNRWISVSTDYARPRTSGAGDAWAEDAARQGRTGTHRLREVTTVRPPSDVAEALGLKPDEQAVVRRRVVLLDDRPVELADSYYPVRIADGTALALSQKIRGGAATLLAELGHRIQRLSEEVWVRMPAAEERQLLDLPPDQPVMILFRLATSADGRPIEATVMTLADGRRLRYELAL